MTKTKTKTGKISYKISPLDTGHFYHPNLTQCLVFYFIFCPKNCGDVVIFAILLLRFSKTVWHGQIRLKFRIIDLNVSIGSSLDGKCPVLASLSRPNNPIRTGVCGGGRGR